MMGEDLTATEAISKLIKLRDSHQSRYTTVQDLFIEMPHPSQQIYAGDLEKHASYSGSVGWRNVTCVLTEDILAMSVQGENSCIDWIPLCEIVSVHQCNYMSEVKEVVETEKASQQASTLALVSSSFSKVRQYSFLKEESSSHALDILGDSEEANCFQIETAEMGHNSGRVYLFRCAKTHTCRVWFENIRSAMAIAARKKNEDKANQMSAQERLLAMMDAIYSSRRFLYFSQLSITLSFLLSAVEVELRPAEGTSMRSFFLFLNALITLLFAAELGVELAAHRVRRYFKSTWRIFDFIVVMSSLIAIGGWFPVLNQLRSLRTLRLLRLLDQIKSLRLIMQGLSQALLPVMNTFLMLGLVTCVYAIMAVEFFGERNKRFFGTFSSSLFTMFQCVTGDSWASSVTRSLLDDDSRISFSTALFFTSYMLIASILLINIIVAVLLDEFLATMSKARQEEKAKSAPLRDFNSLDPLLQVLSHFKSPEDLDASLRAIFKRLDVDGSGTVSFQETDEGLRKLMGQAFYLSVEDWQEMTADVQGGDSSLSFESFEGVMKQQLGLFLHRGVNRALEGAGKPKDAILLALKWLLLKQEGRREEEKLQELSSASAAMAEEMKEMKVLLTAFMQRDVDCGQKRLEKMSDMLERLVEKVEGKASSSSDDDTRKPEVDDEEQVEDEDKEKGTGEEETRGEKSQQEQAEIVQQDMISFAEGDEDKTLKDVLHISLE